MSSIGSGSPESPDRAVKAPGPLPRKPLTGLDVELLKPETLNLDRKPPDKIEISEDLKKTSKLKTTIFEIGEKTFDFVQDAKFDHTIPLDQIDNFSDLTVYLADELAGIKPEDIKVPEQVSGLLGDKTGQKLSAADQKYLEKLRNSDVNVEKSEEKLFIKKKKDGLESFYQKEDDTYSVNSDLKNKLALKYSHKDEAGVSDNYGAEGNRGNIEALADSTPENINKFKQVSKNFPTVSEAEALKLHDDLISAKTRNDKEKVADAFLKAKGREGFRYMESLGWQDRSIGLDVTVDNNKSRLFVSRHDILAAYEFNGTGGEAAVGKSRIRLKGQLNGKFAEFEVSRQSFLLAFGKNSDAARVELGKEKIDINLSKLGNNIQLKIDHGEYRIGGGVAGYVYSARLTRKDNEAFSKAEHNGQKFHSLVLKKERVTGGDATVPGAAVKAQLGGEREKELTVNFLQPLTGNNLEKAEKERMLEIAGNVKETGSISAELVKKLKPGEKLAAAGRKEFEIRLGADASGVKVKEQYEHLREFGISVEACENNSVQVKIELEKSHKNTAELNASGNKLSHQHQKNFKETVEFEADLSTPEGIADYEKALAMLNEGKLPQKEDFSPVTGLSFMSHDSSGKKNSIGGSVTVAAFTRTRENNISHNQDGTTTLKYDSIYKKEDKKIPVVNKLIDNETKALHGKGLIESDGDLDNGVISLSLNDSRVRKGEITRYHNNTGIGTEKLSDLKGEETSIKAGIAFNQQNIKQLVSLAGNGSLEKYADETDGVRRKEAEEFRQEILAADSDESRIRVLLDFTAKNGKAGFEFLRRLENNDCQPVFPVTETEVKGSKLTSLLNSLNEAEKKMENYHEQKPKKLRKMIHEFKDIRNEADAQVKFLNHYKEKGVITGDSKKTIEQKIKELENVSHKASENLELLRRFLNMTEEELQAEMNTEPDIIDIEN